MLFKVLGVDYIGVEIDRIWLERSKFQFFEAPMIANNPEEVHLFVQKQSLEEVHFPKASAVAY